MAAQLAGDSLHRAQINKLQALVDAAGICAQDHVLEIGCGWGSLAIHAVQACARPSELMPDAVLCPPDTA